MNLLIDSHAVIWFITEDDRLPKKVRDLIYDSENECLVSIASLWEMGIKHSLGKLDLNASLEKIFELIDQSKWLWVDAHHSKAHPNKCNASFSSSRSI